ncbi:MAG: hypothetical protein HC831_16685 [Chloroflexia bacterium]|nr:hypothetical protein [Chloroflexia bacterium]
MESNKIIEVIDLKKSLGPQLAEPKNPDLRVPSSINSSYVVEIKREKPLDLDADKIKSIEDIKRILKAMNISFSESIMREFEIEHLIKS